MLQHTLEPNTFNFIPKKIEILLAAAQSASNRMTNPNDKDMKYLEGLVKNETWRDSSANDNLTHKLLYLILEETAASRRRAEKTNELLAEIADSLKKSTKCLERLAKTTVITNREGDLSLRIFTHN